MFFNPDEGEYPDGEAAHAAWVDAPIVARTEILAAVSGGKSRSQGVADEVFIRMRERIVDALTRLDKGALTRRLPLDASQTSVQRLGRPMY